VFPSTRRKRIGAAASAFALCATLMLTGCGGDEPAQQAAKPEEQKLAGQVVARINGEEVSIHELSAERRRVSFPSGTAEEEATRQLLGAVVERKLFTQKAVEAGLDRQPGVLLDLRRAREQVLAQAYLQQQMAARAPVSRQEVEAFVAGNPHMFAQMEKLSFDKIVVPGTAVTDELMGKLNDADTLADVEKVLASAGVAYNRGKGESATAELPADIVTQIKAVKPGKVFMLNTGGVATFATLTAATPEPLLGSDAFNAARRVLEAKRGQEDAEAIRASVRDAGKVEYVGEYAGIMAAPPAATPDATPAPADAPAAPEGKVQKAEAGIAGPQGAAE